jgi:hypothetical protein
MARWNAWISETPRVIEFPEALNFVLLRPWLPVILASTTRRTRSLRGRINDIVSDYR